MQHFDNELAKIKWVWKEGVKNRIYTNVELDLRVSCLIGNACVPCILLNYQLVLSEPER